MFDIYFFLVFTCLFSQFGVTQELQNLPDSEHWQSSQNPILHLQQELLDFCLTSRGVSALLGYKHL